MSRFYCLSTFVSHPCLILSMVYHQLVTFSRLFTSFRCWHGGNWMRKTFFRRDKNNVWPLLRSSVITSNWVRFPRKTIKILYFFSLGIVPTAFNVDVTQCNDLVNFSQFKIKKINKNITLFLWAITWYYLQNEHLRKGSDDWLGLYIDCK